MRDYKKIEVWKRSHLLVLRIYELTQTFPANERYGIISQLHRAVVSVPTNIAEGCGRTTESELVRFMDIAAGSATEVDYLLFLSNELNYLKEEVYSEIHKELTEIRKMLFAYSKTIRNAK